MRQLSCLIAGSLVGIACSKGLQLGGADAGRDSGPVACVEPPPESCGYDCQNGRWVRIPLLCMLPDSGIPDSAVPDRAVPDSAAPDSAVPDSAVPDSAVPDSAVPDSDIPDLLGKDANGIDTRVTDASDTAVPDGAVARYDAEAPAACANLARTWLLGGSCMGHHATFNGTFTAQMAQTGCTLTFTQTDGTTEWTTTGVLESNGRGYLKGQFGFTDSGMCDLTVNTATSWSMICASATQQCQLEAKPVPDLY
jgi:hypothetical protein